MMHARGLQSILGHIAMAAVTVTNQQAVTRPTTRRMSSALTRPPGVCFAAVGAARQGADLILRIVVNQQIGTTPPTNR